MQVHNFRSTRNILAFTITGILLLAACDSSASVGYRPPVLPVKFVLDSSGNISVEGEASIVTFLGEFSIGADYTVNRQPDTIMVILRDRNKGRLGMDQIYRVQSG